MREIEMWEIWHDKCPVCGAHNKLHTELLDPSTHKLVGYTIKCCMCGYYRTFFNSHDFHGVQGIPDFNYARQRCLQPSFCPHRDCKLFGTCTYKQLDIKKKPKTPCKKKCDCKNKEPKENTEIRTIESQPRFL